ncbi:hypothetical protein H4K36_35785 [Streptomyces sp. DHE7-1]|nr:hypothetical protein [Streptomyces sp. DHE7-1]
MAACEREVTLALKRAVLPVPTPVGRHRGTVRHRSEIGSLNVRGDWYDLIQFHDSDKIAEGPTAGREMFVTTGPHRLTPHLVSLGQVPDAELPQVT